MTDIEIKDVPESHQNDDLLIGIIENQLQVIVTITEMDGGLYDELADDRIRTMSGAFRLIREAQKRLMDDVKNMGKG
jgi:hypothetical protein